MQYPYYSIKDTHCLLSNIKDEYKFAIPVFCKEKLLHEVVCFVQQSPVSDVESRQIQRIKSSEEFLYGALDLVRTALCVRLDVERHVRIMQ